MDFEGLRELVRELSAARVAAQAWHSDCTAIACDRRDASVMKPGGDYELGQSGRSEDPSD